MEILSKLIGIKELQDSFPYSHVAFPVFLLKKYNKTFEEFEKELKEKKFIEKVWLENNFVNIKFNTDILDFLNEKEKKEKKEIYLVEHTSNNPTGPLHIGRVRSSFIGDFYANALDYLGYKVKRHFYVNDLGKQIVLIYLAKKLGIKGNFEFNNYSKPYLDREDYQTILYYIAANEKYKSDEEFKKKVDNFLKEAEEKKELLKELKETAEFALKGIKKTFERLNVKFDSFDYESNFLEDTKKYLKLIAKKLNLKGHPFVVKIKNEEVYLTRSDGTTTYVSRDIAYHKYKEKLADYLINVLGEDHKREFLVLKELLNIVGFEKNLDSIFFSFLTLNGEKLSTRKGNILTVDELIDMGKGKIKGSDEQKEKLAIASLKVYLLNTNVNKPIDFRWDLALKTEGETGVYLIYTYARINSILEKSEKKGENIEKSKFSQKMLDLLIYSSFFDYYLEQSVKRKNPAIFMKYLFNLAKLFNRFYNEEKVIGSENENEKTYLLNKLKNSFEKAFKIVNIPYLSKIEQ